MLSFLGRSLLIVEAEFPELLFLGWRAGEEDSSIW